MKLILLIATTLTLGVAASTLDLAKKPTIENVPEHLGTYGGLNDPINVEPMEPDAAVKYTIVNLTGCSMTTKFWMGGVDGAGNPLTPNRVIDFISVGGSAQITVGDIRTAFSSATGTITGTNAGIEWQIPGMSSWIVFYPNGPSNPQMFPTGLPSPCNCVKATWNEATRTVTFENC